jgi:hypothetical protein
MSPGKRDWFKFAIHFLCSATLGAAIGLGVWSQPQLNLGNSGLAGAFCIVGGALFIGLAAAIATDEFWESFRK